MQSFKVSIFRFLDYHEYLRTWYKQEKESGTKVTMQKLADVAGFKSKSYIQRVISGAKAVSRKSICQFNEMLGHSEKESEFFMLLVHFKHAKSDGEKARCLRKLQEQSDSLIHNLESKRFEFFNTWYHPVIREVISTVPFKEDYLKLARSIKPEITAKQAHDSVSLLLELGLIKLSRGKYVQLQSSVIAQSETDYMALREFQRMMIRLGGEAIDRFDPPERNVVSITAGLSYENAEKINKMISQFQKSIIAISNLEQNVETAQQINIQRFPVSKPLTPKRGNT
ncbi:MAG: TIGR02147 family protein [Fibrobacterales bacterium]